MPTRLKFKPKDDSPFIEGNALDDNWWHLYIPSKFKQGKFQVYNEDSFRLMRLIKELGIESKVQIISEPVDKNLEFLEYGVLKKTDLPKPYLEIVNGCEAGILNWYTDLKEIVDELYIVKKRLDYLRSINN